MCDHTPIAIGGGASGLQLGTAKTVLGTARGRVRVDSTRDNKDSSRDSQGYRVCVDSTRDNKDRQPGVGYVWTQVGTAKTVVGTARGRLN